VAMTMAMVTRPIPGHPRPAFGIGAIPIKGFTLRCPNARFRGNKSFSDEPEPAFGLVKAAADFDPAAGLFSRQRKPSICIALPADPRRITGPYPDFLKPSNRSGSRSQSGRSSSTARLDCSTTLEIDFEKRG